MHPAESSEGVGQVSRDRQAEASFPLELGQWIYGSRSSKAACDCYCCISLLTVQLHLGEFVGWLFGLGSLFIGRFTLSKPAAYQELATLLEKVE